jgi:hypothetical protein
MSATESDFRRLGGQTTDKSFFIDSFRKERTGGNPLTNNIMDEPIVTEEAPSQININGTDYSPEDAQALIELGNKTRELEKSWNSPIDSLASAYGKSQAEVTELRKAKETYEQQINEFKSKQNLGTDTAADEAKAKEAARKLGIVLSEDLDKNGYVKKDDLDKYLSEREQKSNAVKAVLEEADKLERDINGEDGRPKFNKKMVLAWAQAYGKSDLMEAYKDMHGDTLKEWEKSQIEAKKTPSLKTFKPSSKKEPGDVKVGEDNVKDLLKETLWGQS